MCSAQGPSPTLYRQSFAESYGGATHRVVDGNRCSREARDTGERRRVATQPGRHDRALRAANPQRSPAMVVAREGDAVDESFFCAREIKRLYAESPHLRLCGFATVPPSTTWLAGPFAEPLRALGRPYDARGSGPTPRTAVVRSLAAHP